MQQSIFDHQPRTRLVFGAGSVDRTGELAREVGAKKILLVTDAGIVAAGHAGHVQKSLEVAGLSVTLFDKVKANPTTRCVEDCVAVAKAADVDLIIGLGGGSSMDTAKGCNFILTNGGRMQDYWGVGKATKPMLPLIAIPTTAGTGSECQCAALIADEQTHQKMACLDPKAAARIAILDPALTLSQPPRVTACTGIDAVAHAVETAVTTKRTPLSLMYSREAFRLCVRAFPEVMLNSNDLEARGRMLLGAAFAGLAIENSMLGAAHALANPLTARYGVVHGEAVGLMLPHVVQFNGADPATRAAYAELAVAAGIAGVGDTHEHALHTLLARLENILNLANLPRALTECGVEEAAIPALAEAAAGQWTAGFNPRPVRADDLAALYRAAWQTPVQRAPKAECSSCGETTSY
ncbi:MAG: iron-containing alcohol dehydrogenase [Verrucomicrobia bacterium]|nr:iron-containing alcohol dehydrogenase [Verrucomicrobiota bacterium]